MKTLATRSGLSNRAFIFAIVFAGFSLCQSPGRAKPDAKKDAAKIQAANNVYVHKIMHAIRGRDGQPAAKVFKNIRIPLFKSVPANRFLRIMNLGFARSLGVACTYCHNDQDFSSDEKRPKRAAREMWGMRRSINERLNQMKDLKPAPRGHFINCTTCHRGRVNPMNSEE